MKKCLYCKKVIKKNKPKKRIVNKYFSKKLKRYVYHKYYETNRLLKRLLSKKKFCNRKCSCYYLSKQKGNTLWNKNLCIKYFLNIKDERKYNSTWVAENHGKFFSAVSDYWGKNYWTRFIHKMGGNPKPKYKKLSFVFLKRLRELEYKVGDIFLMSHGDFETDYSSRGTIQGAVNYLKRLKVIKFVSGKCMPREGQESYYKLLKLRI